jgi:signal transduction histidine kinase
VRGLPERVSRADLGLAGLTGALMAVEAGSPAHGTPLVSVPLAVLCGLALAGRRRWPAEVAVLVAALQVPLALLADGPFPPQLPVVPLLLAVYAAALGLTGRRAAVTAVLTLVLSVAAHALSGDGEAADFLPYLLWAGPAAAGRLVRRRTLEAAAAATTAAEVVARQELETREAVARERDLIARELHDVVAHAVSLMVVQAGAERLALREGADAARTAAALAAVEAAGREALGELRTMLAVLRDADGPGDGRSPRPDLTGVPSLAARVRAAGTPVVLRADGDLSGLPAGVGLSAYRAVQEALTNAVRHAPGCPVDLDVEVGPAGVLVRASNPLPAVPAQGGSGRGLLGLRERAALHGGSAQAGPVDGRWVVEVRLPVPVRAPA